MVEITLVIPADVLDDLACAIADALPLKRRVESRWLAGAAAAADHLGWPVQRVYKQLHVLPHVKHGARLMFESEELDDYMRALGRAPDGITNKRGRRNVKGLQRAAFQSLSIIPQTRMNRSSPL